MMQTIYLATTYAAAIICLLTSLLLFSQRRHGEPSRVILACIILFSVMNYMIRLADLCHGEEPELVISMPMLLLAIFMVISYIMYPIEVISPGYLNIRRVVQIYIPWFVLLGVYLLCEKLGVVFVPYYSLSDMLPDVTRFDVWFRLLLVLLIFVPVLTILFIPYTRRYSNAGRWWIMRYLLLFSINTIAYILILSIDSLIVKILYYYISVGCSLGIAYMELFVRLIEKPAFQNETMETICVTQPESTSPVSEALSATDESQCESVKTSTQKTAPQLLCDKLQSYMSQTYAYRDPDLSIQALSTALRTNRTTLGHTIRLLGHESFTTYINTLRVQDFIEQIKKRKPDSFQNAFYNAGFRSRTTAIRNFRMITGMTPSEFFQQEFSKYHPE